MSYQAKVLISILLCFLVIGLATAKEKPLTSKEQLQNVCKVKVPGYQTVVLIYQGGIVITKMKKIHPGYFTILGGDRISAIKVGDISLMCKPKIYSVQKVFSKIGSGAGGSPEGTGVMYDV